MNKLSNEQINEALDLFNDWLTHSNVVSIDLLECPLKDSGIEYELVVGTLSKVDHETLQSKARAAGILRRALEVPEYVSFPALTGSLAQDESLAPRQARVREITVDPIEEDHAWTDSQDIIEESPAAVLRPCPGGVLIKTAGFTGRGTLGVSLQYRGSYRILSNNHVLAKNGSLGVTVYQPPEEDPANRLACVSGYDEIQYYPTPVVQDPRLNKRDVAWCDSDEKVSVPDILHIGRPRGWRLPRRGEEVELFGGSTRQRRRAKIRSTTLRYHSRGRLGYAFWKHGIELDALVTQPGDSGAAYVSVEDGMVVGLHRAGGSSSKGCPL